MKNNQDTNALISIIVPIYNVEKYIHRCIDSICAQTYYNLEIILVDDGSPDGCPEICDEYAQSDSRIRVIHKTNEGLGAARNTGLEICRGEYVMFVDSDDYLCTDAVLAMYERLAADESDIAIGAHTDVYDDGKTNGRFCAFMKDMVMSRDEFFCRMAKYSASAWGKLYKREIINNIRYPSLRYAEDTYVFPEVISRCTRVSILDKTVYYYYQNKESITHKKEPTDLPDEIEGLLHASAYLWRRGVSESASHYFEKAVSKALLLQNRIGGKKLFKEHFSVSERKQLLKLLSPKKRVKYLLLHIPFAPAIFRSIKK